MGKVDDQDSATSSIDSSEDPSATMNAAATGSSSSYNYYSTDLSTDLRLGLSISNDNSSTTTSPRELQYPDWPPIKPSLKSTLAGTNASRRRCRRDHGGAGEAADASTSSSVSLFVKVYMEGIPIGRKLDLLSLHGYDSLVTTLSHMFRTTISCPDHGDHQSFFNSYYILTYQDEEGDWMMVGDVPWELFLTAVKRLKITAVNNC